MDQNIHLMKLITWNCQGAFRKKAAQILLHRPDILVVPECEHPDKLVFNSDTPKPNDLLWAGDNVHKGLGVFSYGDYKFQLHEQHNEALKIILPIAVTGGQFDLLFLPFGPTTARTRMGNTWSKPGKPCTTMTNF